MLNILTKINKSIKEYRYYKNLAEQEGSNKQRRLNILDTFENNIKDSFNKLDSIIKQKRDEQAHFSKLKLRKNGAFSKEILIGQNTINDIEEINLKNNKIPMIHKFLFEHGFYSSNYDNGEYFSMLLMLRLLSISPLNKLQFTLIDTHSLGKHFKRIRAILHNDFIYNNRILTYDKEIARSLKELADYMENVLQHQLVKYENWEEFNQQNPKLLLPLKVLIIFGFDDEFNSESILYLNRIVKFGIECGILPIIIGNMELLENERDKNKLDLHSNLSKLNPIEAFLNSTYDGLDLLNLAAHRERLPEESELNSFLESITSFYAEDSHIKYDIEDLLNKSEFWSKNSTNGIKIPIAKDINENIVYFEVGHIESEHHTLIGGRSGSGKSNLLHAMIASLCFYYPPEELELFLLDYKEGVEFNTYANPPLNHASLIAIHSNVQYGASFLEYIIETKNNRAELFKKEGVKDFKEYREKSGKKLPRMLIIIDEFQVLLKGNLKQINYIQGLFVEILRKGRSYGIHLTLSTQSLKGMQVDIGEIKGQIGNRIALMMGTDDSQNILSSGNVAAASLRGKPYGIFNFEAGTNEANILASVPFASELSINNLLQKMAKEKRKNVNKIYDGDRQIFLPRHLENPPHILIFGIMDNYNEAKLEVNLHRGRHIAICSRDKKDTALNVLLHNLGGKKIHHIHKKEDIENIEDDSFVVIENYDSLKDLFISKSEFNRSETAKRFKTLLDESAKRNIYIVFAIQKIAQVFTDNIIYDFIDHFIVLNIGGGANTILKEESITSDYYAHKDFYYNKIYGDIAEFKLYASNHA